RRSLYMFQRRSYNMTTLSVFDEPVMDTNCTRRNSSAVVLQSLAMLNDGSILQESEVFASRVMKEAGPAPEEWMNRAYRIALGRGPSSKEMSWSLDTLHQIQDRYRGAGKPAEEARRKALAAVCQILLNTNEFLYVQ